MNVESKKGITIIPEGFRELEIGEIILGTDLFEGGNFWKDGEFFSCKGYRYDGKHSISDFPRKVIRKGEARSIDVDGVKISLTSEQVLDIKSKTAKKGDILFFLKEGRPNKDFQMPRFAVCLIDGTLEEIRGINGLPKNLRHATEEEKAFFKKYNS